jgi:FeS assembly SUF system protein
MSNTHSNNFLQLEAEIVKVLKTIFDPEIPVNIYELGLIYEIDVDDDNVAKIRMTLTAPNCPMADELLDEVVEKVKAVPGVTDCKLQLTFDPPWDKDMMTEEAKLELGLF